MRTRAWPFSVSRISKHVEVKNVSKKGSDRQGDSSLLAFFFGARFGGDEIEGMRDVTWHVFQNFFHLDLGRLGSSPLIRMPLFISVYIDLYANSKSRTGAGLLQT